MKSYLYTPKKTINQTIPDFLNKDGKYFKKSISFIRYIGMISFCVSAAEIFFVSCMTFGLLCLCFFLITLVNCILYIHFKTELADTKKGLF